MPKHYWFEHIELSGSKGRRSKDVFRKYTARGGNVFAIRKAPELSTYYKIHNHRYQRLRIGNHETWVFRLSDLAAIYGVHVNTVLGWYRKGMLPKPWFTYSGKHRSWGWPDCPIYIQEQIFVITKVLDDIFAQSTQFRLSYQDHIAIMQQGDLMVRERIPYKAVAQETIKPAKPKLRKRPAPHLRPLFREMQAELKKRKQKW